MSGITPFTMLPGAGPACEGDDCLPAAAVEDVRAAEDAAPAA